MDGEQRRRHGQPHAYRAEAGCLREAEDHRHEQDEAHVEEHRDGQQERRAGHRDDGAARTQCSRKSLGERIRSAGDLDEPTQHGAEPDDEHECGGGAAKPTRHRRHDLVQRQPADQGGAERDEEQRHEGRQLDAQDEEQQGSDGCAAEPDQRERGHVSPAGRRWTGRRRSASCGRPSRAWPAPGRRPRWPRGCDGGVGAREPAPRAGPR